MPKIIIDERYCKGCGLCVVVCPKKSIEMSRSLSRRGVNPACAADSKACSGCLNCAVICPDAAIAIVDDSPAKAVR